MIVGKKVILRTVKASDIDEIVTLSQSIRERGDHYPLNIRSEQSWKKLFNETGIWNEQLKFMLVTDLDGRIVGGIFGYDHDALILGLEIGYVIYSPNDREKGFMSEALHLFCAYLFDLSPLVRLYLTVIPDNIASRRIAEKVGFKYEGTCRKAIYTWGKYCDLEMFSLLREDCKGLKEEWGKY